MRLIIEGNPEDLDGKGGALVKALATQLRGVGIDLLDELTKAEPTKARTLKHRALRDLDKRTTTVYEHMMADMITAIGKVLDDGVSKSTQSMNVIDREDKAYKKAKAVLINLGRKEDEFDDGGVLSNHSVNQLIELVRQART